MRTLKHLLGRSLYAIRLDALLMRNEAVVVAFHRVRDDTPDSDALTIDTRTFESYCRFFARFFNVVSLPALTTMLESGRPPNRTLAITFDDGYRDNFTNAAPILEKLSLPATFFVVSRWVGTSIVPFWDRARGVEYPWMDWSEIKALHARGFEIGAHTRTHVDLGAVSGNAAQREIAGAREDLESALGVRVDSFAYPFGTQNHLTEANRSFVRAAGFRCCCSAFGGTVTRATDPFHIPRVPISTWHPYPYQFGFDVSLGRSVDTPSSEQSEKLCCATSEATGF
jgi:peptidoglycan/xylan/chitin deacetylase (PgdA/CDA1 family)